MKTILSLVLPTKATWRYINKGRKALGFVDSVLATRDAEGNIHGVNELTASDVDSSVATGDVINKRLNVVVGTTPTVTLPLAAAFPREVYILNTASGACTVDGSGSEVILTGTADAANVSVATGKAAKLLSDGTRWYHVSNDA